MWEVIDTAVDLQPFDILILAILLITFFRGWMKGLTWQIASILSIVASYFVAVQFRKPLGAKIAATPPWNNLVAMLVLYLGTSLTVWVFFRQVRRSIDRMKLRDFDHQLGALVGIVKGLCLSGIVTLFAVSLSGEETRQTILTSKSGKLIARMMAGAADIMPPELRAILAPHLDRLDQGLQQTGVPAGTNDRPGYHLNYAPKEDPSCIATCDSPCPRGDMFRGKIAKPLEKPTATEHKRHYRTLQQRDQQAVLMGT